MIDQGACAHPGEVRRKWMARPFAHAGDGYACDGRSCLLLDGAEGAVAELPEGGPSESERDMAAGFFHEGDELLGTIALRALAEWSGPYACCCDIDGPCEPEPALALIGPAVFDKVLLAKMTHLLALAGDGVVRVAIQAVGIHAAFHYRLRLDGESWAAVVMACDPPMENRPGEETRLALDDTKGA